MLCKKKICSLIFFRVINISLCLVLLLSNLPLRGEDLDAALDKSYPPANNSEIEDGSSVELNEDINVLKGYVSKVPGGTKLKIIVETPIDEGTSQLNDEFLAKTSENVVIDEKVVIPAGSTVSGKISEINLAKRLHKAGSVRIDFQHLSTPGGREVPIVASVLTHSGLLKGRYTRKTALISSATVVTPIAAGVGAGLAADSSAFGAAVGAALGALAGVALFAFQRGNMVDIKAGDELNIELTEEALVPSETTSTSSSGIKLEEEDGL